MSAASPSNNNNNNSNNGSQTSPSMDSSMDGAIDTTLLESLFYNEMMMLDDSSDLLSTVTGVNFNGEATNTSSATTSIQGKQTGSQDPTMTISSLGTSTKEITSDDPLTCAEQSLLQEFDVSNANNASSEKSAGTAQDPAAHLQTHSTPQNGWENVQNSNYYPHHNQDPHRHHPHQLQYQARQPPPSQTYTPNSHHAPPPHSTHPQHYQQHQQSQPPYIQPRPLHRQVSKGIKHSVIPRQEVPPGNHSQESQGSIPNPLVQAYPPQPPDFHATHSQHRPAHYPPPASQHLHTSHYLQYSQHPSQQAPPPHASHYHQPAHLSPPPPPAPAPPGNGPTPALVPVPAPESAHHHSAYGAPTPTTGHVSPSYDTSPVAPHAVMPPPAGHPQHHTSTNIHHTYPSNHQQPPKEQLVSQFATLANRLGINLPNNLLASLTESAGIASATVGEAAPVLPLPKTAIKREESQSSTAQTTTKTTTTATDGVTQSGDAAGTKVISGPTPETSTSTTTLPGAEALRKTAEEAFAAVTRKRTHEEADLARQTSTSSLHGGGGSGSESKSAYAKRKKKPRMADCEQRLAHLHAENEKLKRHLDNVTNQTHKFEQDRIKAEITMREMLESDDVPEKELDKVIREYSDAYSDYGRRRHEELSFHLEQLQKLANPTNFTKMGLWTIAKANGSKDMSKQNPLVGILQKELNIASHQVRKILEQREKIRELCNNLNASLLLLQKLKDLCEQKNKTFNDRMKKTQEILSPKQVVKLILWIKEHSNVLENICPGWTSEQVVKGSKKAITVLPANSAGAQPTVHREKLSERHMETATSSEATKEV